MKRAALIITARTKKNQDFRDIPGVDGDAAEVHTFFRSASYDIVNILRDPSRNEIETTLPNIRDQLSSGDLLVIYFAGHGHYVNGHNVLLCPDARFNTLSHFREAIPVDYLRVETADLGLHRLLILDCCRDTLYQAGTRGGPEGLQGTDGLRNIGVVPIGAGGGSFHVLWGCSQGQVAPEIPNLQRGLFTTALIEVFNSCLAREGFVGITDPVFEAVSKRMIELKATHGLPPFPLAPERSGNGPLPMIVHRPGFVPIVMSFLEAEKVVRAAVNEFLEYRLTWDHAAWTGLLQSVRKQVTPAVMSDAAIGKLLETEAAIRRQKRQEVERQQREESERKRQEQERARQEEQRQRQQNDVAQQRAAYEAKRPSTAVVAKVQSKTPAEPSALAMIMAVLIVFVLPLVGIIYGIGKYVHHRSLVNHTYDGTWTVYHMVRNTVRTFTGSARVISEHNGKLWLSVESSEELSFPNIAADRNAGTSLSLPEYKLTIEFPEGQIRTVNQFAAIDQHASDGTPLLLLEVDAAGEQKLEEGTHYLTSPRNVTPVKWFKADNTGVAQYLAQRYGIETNTLH